MADPDEIKLAELAKRVLSMPPKKRTDSKVGKSKAEAEFKASPAKKHEREATPSQR